MEMKHHHHLQLALKVSGLRAKLPNSRLALVRQHIGAESAYQSETCDCCWTDVCMCV